MQQFNPRDYERKKPLCLHRLEFLIFTWFSSRNFHVIWLSESFVYWSIWSKSFFAQDALEIEECALQKEPEIRYYYNNSPQEMVMRLVSSLFPDYELLNLKVEIIYYLNRQAYALLCGTLYTPLTSNSFLFYFKRYSILKAVYKLEYKRL